MSLYSIILKKERRKTNEEATCLKKLPTVRVTGLNEESMFSSPSDKLVFRFKPGCLYSNVELLDPESPKALPNIDITNTRMVAGEQGNTRRHMCDLNV